MKSTSSDLSTSKLMTENDASSLERMKPHPIKEIKNAEYMKVDTESYVFTSSRYSRSSRNS
jgi:hypothetical protein